MEERLTFFAKLFKVDENPELGMWLLYGTIVILSILAYKLGFSYKLSVMKSALIYIFLILGCTILSFLGVFLPVAEGLVVICVFLLIYRIRRRAEKNKTNESEDTPL